jgi:hypothetical protein
VTLPPEPSPGGTPPARARASRSFVMSLVGAAARGTGLIALAVAIGVVLLQYSDHSKDQLSAAKRPIGVAPALVESSTTTSTGPRAAAQVSVLVLNASGRANQAHPMAERLKVVGYRTLEPGNAPRRPASTVGCRAGLDQEAPALVAATGLPAKVEALSPADAALPNVAEADCVVIIGSQ